MMQGSDNSAIGGSVRQLPAIHFVTVVREPARHLMSWFNYFVHPLEPQLTFTTWLYQLHMNNSTIPTIAGEFGLQTLPQAADWLYGPSPNAGRIFFMVTERLEESLLVLQHTLGLTIDELASLQLCDTRDGNAKREWDGKNVTSYSHRELLASVNSNSTVAGVFQEALKVSYKLYSFADQELTRRVNETMAAVTPASWQKSKLQLQTFNKELQRLCPDSEEAPSMSIAPSNICQPYRITDLHMGGLANLAGCVPRSLLTEIDGFWPSVDLFRPMVPTSVV
jgi:hypothetical protein